jgi:hypothetical protein
VTICGKWHWRGPWSLGKMKMCKLPGWEGQTPWRSNLPGGKTQSLQNLNKANIQPCTVGWSSTEVLEASVIQVSCPGQRNHKPATLLFLWMLVWILNATKVVRTSPGTWLQRQWCATENTENTEDSQA